MILPSKHISPAKSLIGLGGKILKRLPSPKTVNDLWENIRGDQDFGNYERFILTLDLLFLIGCIKIEKGRVYRCKND